MFMQDEKKKNWVSHAEWLSLMITIFGSVYFLESRFESRFQDQISRSNDQIYRIESQIQSQGERTDRLYEMFIDLLKEKK